MITVATSIPRKWKLGSWLITLYQNTNYSHCLIVDGLEVYEASHGRVRKVPKYDWVIENKIVFSKELHPSLIDMDYVVSMVGVKYGFGQIFEIALKYFLGVTLKRNNGNSRLICSEYVGRALRLPWVNDYTSPRDIEEYLKRL